MNRILNIAVAIGVSAFLATNIYLLFSEKTILAKSVFVNKYERVVADSFSEELPKEGFIEPVDTYTVYVGSDDAIESWLVNEGEAVFAGDELATLNTERADGQRDAWEAESNALAQQENEVSTLLSDLENKNKDAKSSVTSNVDRQKNDVTNVEGKTTIEFGLGVDFNVDVTQEGAYAQAIAAAEQQLTDIARQLTVVNAQLEQDSSHPAIVSPVDGVVSTITRLGSTLAVDIFSTEKIVKTYAKDNEWQRIEIGDRVVLQGDSIDGAEEGTVLSVSEIPAKSDLALEAYKKLDAKEATNPLAYYEVQIETDANLNEVPYGNNVNTIVITNEVADAIAVNEKWLQGNDDNVVGMIIHESGSIVDVQVTTPFTWKTRAVVTDGFDAGDIVVDKSYFRDYASPPRVFMSMPTAIPTKAEWRAFGWRNYLKYFLIE